MLEHLSRRSAVPDDVPPIHKRYACRTSMRREEELELGITTTKKRAGMDMPKLNPQAARITAETIELAALMQVKALAFDSEHPDNPFGTSTAAAYANAIRALALETEQEEVAMLMMQASIRVMQRLLLSQANMQLPA
jgi:hypothetical protein